jgi:hypothetical protein
MAKERINGSKENEDHHRAHKPDPQQAAHERPGSALATFQQQVGNRALRRLIVQRSTSVPADLDDETATRINHERGSGQTLDSALQEQAGTALGADFSGVRVHDSLEADTLNRQLNARAFTTGQDIFFREGEYQPNSLSGQELIAHELTHVVQQSSGAVSGSSGRMTVNPPGDRFEQEADAAARQAVQAGGTAGVQRQDAAEDEELQAKSLQRQEETEEEELQAKSLQRQEMPEEGEEELAQRQEMEDEEEGRI